MGQLLNCMIHIRCHKLFILPLFWLFSTNILPITVLFWWSEISMLYTTIVKFFQRHVLIRINKEVSIAFPILSPAESHTTAKSDQLHCHSRYCLSYLSLKYKILPEKYIQTQLTFNAPIFHFSSGAIQCSVKIKNHNLFTRWIFKTRLEFINRIHL